MEKQPPKPITPLDELVTPKSLYMMKLLLPYFPVTMQRTLAMFMKLSELHNTFNLFWGFASSGNKTSSNDILHDLLPYMDPQEQEMMGQFENIMAMMEMMHQTQNTGTSFDFMKTMMDPQQQEMFDMYSAIFDEELKAAPGSEKEGESDNE